MSGNSFFSVYMESKHLFDGEIDTYKTCLATCNTEIHANFLVTVLDAHRAAMLATDASCPVALYNIICAQAWRDS